MRRRYVVGSFLVVGLVALGLAWLSQGTHAQVNGNGQKAKAEEPLPMGQPSRSADLEAAADELATRSLRAEAHVGAAVGAKILAFHMQGRPQGAPFHSHADAELGLRAAFRRLRGRGCVAGGTSSTGNV